MNSPSKGHEYSVLMRRYNDDMDGDELFMLGCFPDAYSCERYIENKEYQEHGIKTKDILIVCDTARVVSYQDHHSSAYIVDGNLVPIKFAILVPIKFAIVHQSIFPYAKNWFYAWEGPNTEADDMLSYARLVEFDCVKIIGSLISVHEYFEHHKCLMSDFHEKAINHAKSFAAGTLDEDVVRKDFSDINSKHDRGGEFHLPDYLARELMGVLLQDKRYSASQYIQSYASFCSIKHGHHGDLNRSEIRRQLSDVVRNVIPLRDILIQSIEHYGKLK